MTNSDHNLDRKLVLSLFDNYTIEVYLENFAEKDIFNRFTKTFLYESAPISFICACTTEGFLAKSHFYTSSLLNMLVCLRKIKVHRLAHDNQIGEFEEFFKDSLLGNEPLYRLSEPAQKSDKFIAVEMTALQATDRILSAYSGTSEKYFMHPFKVYWFLTDKLRIDQKIASQYHSAQGLVRLIIIYLLHYKKFPSGRYPDLDTILSLYKDLEAEIQDDEPTILPQGLDYDFQRVFRILTIFFDEFVKQAKSKNSKYKLLDLSNLTNLAIQTLRLINEYQSASIIKEMNSVLSMMDTKLKILYNDLKGNSLANYHYVDRWLEKCKITTRYRPLDFIDSAEMQADMSQFSPV